MKKVLDFVKKVGAKFSGKKMKRRPDFSKNIKKEAN